MHAISVTDFDEAYEWLCRSRKKHPPSSDIRDLRRKWGQIRDGIAAAFHAGIYRFDVQSKITLAAGEAIAMCSSPDSLVLKVLTWIIEEKLNPAPSRSVPSEGARRAQGIIDPRTGSARARALTNRNGPKFTQYQGVPFHLKKCSFLS